MDPFPPDEARELEQSNGALDDVVPNYDVDLFDEIIQSLGHNENVSYIEANEGFLLEYLEAKMNQGAYDLVIKVLKQTCVTCNWNPRFLAFWDEAHYKIYQKSKSTELTALQRFRIRKRNPPPVGICPEGERPTLRMSDDARSVLRKWFRQHEKNPYPSRRKKEQLAESAGVSINQVTTWFANARRKKNRRKGTKPDTSNTSKFSKKLENQVPTPRDSSPPNSSQPRCKVASTPSQSAPFAPFTVNVPRERPSLFGSPVNKYQTGHRPALKPMSTYGLAYNQPATVQSHTTMTKSAGCGQLPHIHVDAHRHVNEMSCCNHGYNTPPMTSPPFVCRQKLFPKDPPRRAILNCQDRQCCQQHGYSRPKTNRSSRDKPKTGTRRLESDVIKRIRLKLQKKHLQNALQVSCGQVTAMESLLALRQLCDNIETSVVSPVDYAATVMFCECEQCLDIESVNNQTEARFPKDACYPSPLYADTYIPAFQQKPRTCSLEQAAGTSFLLKSDDVCTMNDRREQMPDTQPMHTRAMGSSSQTECLCLSPVSAISPYLSCRNHFCQTPSLPTLGLARNSPMQYVLAGEDQWSPCSQGSYAAIGSTATSPFDNDNRERLHSEQDTTKLSQLQESYGTVVGEAIQGLLNLSSQESE